jgi:succinate dehydrogenase / fumarate reductase iron-sulfur subunit
VKEVTFVVERYDGSDSYLQEYIFACREGMTVLDALIEIKEKQDPSLNFTASCRSAICGSCAVRVNGNAVLACDTRLDDLLRRWSSNILTVGPLANFRVISDLVVDWDEKLSRLRAVCPGLIADEGVFGQNGSLQSPRNVDMVHEMWNCNLCGACASECNKLAQDAADFLEPFVFTAARKFAEDSRSDDPLHHLEPALQNGLWKCFYCQECVTKCPQGVKPAEDISRMREATMRAGFVKTAGPRHARSFLKDMENTGRLDEIKLGLRTEGLWKSMGRLPLVFRLIARGKISLRNRPRVITGHDRLQDMLRLRRGELKR